MSAPPTVHTIAGDVDLGSVERWESELEPVCGRTGSVVQLDLSAVTFLDSTGLRMLVRFRRLCDAAGGALILLEPSEAVRSVLALAHLTDHFSIESR